MKCVRFRIAYSLTGAVTRAGDTSFRLKRTGGRVMLEEGEHVIGRDPDAEIFLDSAGVSRRHARIRISASRATIEDLGSENGTFVGDHRVMSPTSLDDGDIMNIGSTMFTFRIVRTPRSTKTERA